MPQITEVIPQKKIKDRVNIFLDSKFAFSMSLENFVKRNIKVGVVITDEQITKILDEENLQYLVDRAVNFLSFRPRSEKEVRNYIVKKIAAGNEINFSQAQNSSLIDKTFSKLKKLKLINDFEFAKWWLKARSSANPKGVNFVKMELVKKGISKDLIEKVLATAPNQIILAKKAIQKKVKYWQKLTLIEQKRKIYNFLAARGFEREIIESIVAKLDQKR